MSAMRNGEFRSEVIRTEPVSMPFWIARYFSPGIVEAEELDSISTKFSATLTMRISPAQLTGEASGAGGLLRGRSCEKKDPTPAKRGFLSEAAGPSMNSALKAAESPVFLGGVDSFLAAQEASRRAVAMAAEFRRKVFIWGAMRDRVMEMAGVAGR